MDINYIFPLLPLFYVTIEVLQVGREAMLRTVTVAGHFQNTLYQAIIEMTLNIVATVSAMLVCKHFWGNEACLYGALFGTIVALLYRTFDLNRYANIKLLGRSSWKTNKVMYTNIILYGIMYYIMMRFNWISIDSYPKLLIASVVVTAVVLFIFITCQAILNRSEIIYIYIEH